MRATNYFPILAITPCTLALPRQAITLRGAIKSSIGIGVLLYQGIGDTLRVSLTANPVEEIPVAWEILGSLGLRRRGPEIISCPTCGRTEVDLIGLAHKVEERLKLRNRAHKGNGLRGKRPRRGPG